MKRIYFSSLIPFLNPVLSLFFLLVGSILTGNSVFHRPEKAIKLLVVVAVRIDSTFGIIIFDNFLGTWLLPVK